MITTAGSIVLPSMVSFGLQHCKLQETIDGYPLTAMASILLSSFKIS